MKPSKQGIHDALEVDIENGACAEEATRAEAGTAEYLIELEERRSIKVTVIPSYNHRCRIIQIVFDLCPKSCIQNREA